MSKMTKFINNPSLFFEDYFKKRRINTKKDIHKMEANGKSAEVKKAAVAEEKNSFANKAKNALTLLKNVPVNLDTRYFNRFKKYSFYLHCGENMNAGPNHLNMWLPLFISYRVPFLLILRDQKLFSWLLENYPTVDVAYAKAAGDVGEIVAMTSGVNLALYSSSTGNNIHLVRFEEIKHCFIGHGDSDKASSAHKALRMFDEIWVAGQAHIDRFSKKNFNIKGLDFVKIGRPTLLSAINSTKNKWDERFSPKILYLPTWEGSNYKNDYCSIRMAKEILTISAKNASVSAKLHPFTGHRDKSILNSEDQLKKAFADSPKVSVISSSVPLLNIMEGYNIFVCDISSVVTECLSLDAPIFLFYPKNIEIEVAPSNMPFDDYCYVFSSLEEFEELLQRVISGDDFKSEKRKMAIDYFIGLKETENMKMIDLLMNV